MGRFLVMSARSLSRQGRAGQRWKGRMPSAKTARLTCSKASPISGAGAGPLLSMEIPNLARNLSPPGCLLSHIVARYVQQRTRVHAPSPAASMESVDGPVRDGFDEERCSARSATTWPPRRHRRAPTPGSPRRRPRSDPPRLCRTRPARRDYQPEPGSASSRSASTAASLVSARRVAVSRVSVRCRANPRRCSSVSARSGSSSSVR